jgi:hypothetical protein
MKTITAIEDGNLECWSDGDSYVLFLDDQQYQTLVEDGEVEYPFSLETDFYGLSAEKMFEFIRDEGLLMKAVKSFGLRFQV